MVALHLSPCFIPQLSSVCIIFVSHLKCDTFYTMKNYCTRLPATFIGDGYSSWLLYSKGNSKRETGTVEFHSLNLVGFWK